MTKLIASCLKANKEFLGHVRHSLGSESSSSLLRTRYLSLIAQVLSSHVAWMGSTVVKRVPASVWSQGVDS